MGNFYYIDKDYLICDIDCCYESDRSIDLKFNDFAVNTKLLGLLQLAYLSKDHTIKWFAVYFSSLSSINSVKSMKRCKCLKTNPTIRLLVLNEELLEKIKQLKSLNKEVKE